MAVPDARDGLAQLAHIARIVAQQQVFAHGGVQRRRGALCQFGEEMPGQGQDVVLAVAQGRRLATPAGDAVIQVGAEGAARHFVFQLAVGGADEAKLRRLPGIAAHALVFALLDGAQQLRLQRQRQFAHFVEEEHAAVGQGESAVARGRRARERAPFMAEQFAAGQFRRHGGAVEDGKVAAAVADAVDQLRQ